MVAFLKKQWFFVGMVVMVLMAFGLPDLGKFVREYKILKVGIFLAFLITGLNLDTKRALQQLKNVKVLLTALLSSLFIAPAIAYFAAKGVFSSQDIVIGALIIGVSPVTVASGTVLTTLALGNVPLSLFICVLSNLASLITIPFLLKFFLSFEGGIDLPVWQMLFGLMVTVLLPTVVGQVLRPFVKDKLVPYKKSFSNFAQCITLLIIFNGVAGSTKELMSGGGAIIGVVVFTVFVHIFILCFNYFLSKATKLDLPSTAAFTIHTSQKTLTVSYLVWAGFFAHAYPLALLPSIAYHLLQLIMDTVIAQRFRQAIEGREKRRKVETAAAD